MKILYPFMAASFPLIYYRNDLSHLAGKQFGNLLADFSVGVVNSLANAQTIEMMKKNFSILSKGSADIVGSGMKDGSKIFGEHLGEMLENLLEDSGEGIYKGYEYVIKRFTYGSLLNVFPYLLAASATWVAVPLLVQYIYHKAIHAIGKPKLAIERRKITWFTPLTNGYKKVSSKLFKIFFSKEKEFPKAIFSPKLNERMSDLTNAIRNTKKNDGFFQNALLYGTPGTGKTMVTKAIAKNSNMDYILMSGGDLPQYIKRGEHVPEFNKLMDSAEKSSNPTIIFIDEVESFGRKRDHLSPEMIELQNAFLNRTGSPSKKYMIIMATNRPEDLDPAVLSRMDHKIHVPPPELQERKKIIRIYAQYFFTDDEVKIFFNERKCSYLARITTGFSGRALFKMFNCIQMKKFSSSDNVLTHQMIEKTAHDLIEQEREIYKQTHRFGWLTLLISDLSNQIFHFFFSLISFGKNFSNQLTSRITKFSIPA